MTSTKRKRDDDAFLQNVKLPAYLLAAKAKAALLQTVETTAKPAAAQRPAAAAATSAVAEAFTAAPVVAQTTPKRAVVEPKPFLEDPARDDAFCTVSVWLRKPNLPSSQKPLLLIGPPGSGKSYLVDQYGAQPELYDEQDLSDFLQLHALGAERRPGLIDRIETLDTAERALVKRHIQSKGPARRLILIAEDAFLEPTKAWIKLCTVAKLGMPSSGFAVKVLQLHHPDVSEAVCKRVAEAAHNNLSAAMQSLHFGHTGAVSSMYLDTFSDVPKTVQNLFLGRSCGCIGGSGDTSFVGTLLQANTPRGAASLDDASKLLENLSFFDTVDCKHELDGESLWFLLEQTLRPMRKSKVPISPFEWPKSLKPVENPWPY